MTTEHFHYQSQPNYAMQPPLNESEQFIINKEARWKKTFTIMGISCILFVLITFLCLIIFIPSADKPTVEALEEARQQQYSKELPIGVKLMNKDGPMKSLNFTVIHTFNSDTGKIHVWDSGELDGDYVQIFADGIPLSEPFLLRDKPEVFAASTNAVIEVKGIHDVKAGINYGIMFTANEKSYYNYVLEHESNTYLLQQDN